MPPALAPAVAIHRPLPPPDVYGAPEDPSDSVLQEAGHEHVKLQDLPHMLEGTISCGVSLRHSRFSPTDLRGNTLDLAVIAGKVDSHMIQIIAERSFPARILLFGGGFAFFEHKAVHVLYMLVFVGSFLICCSVCSMNVLYGAPPSYDLAMDLLLAYLHVLGLHLWLFWRSFCCNSEVSTFVERALDRFIADETQWMSLCSWLALGAQALVTILGLVALCYPAYDHLSDDLPQGARKFPLAHAITMLVVLPQHIPTVLASSMIFLLVIAAHCDDIRHVKDVLQDESDDLDHRRSKWQGACKLVDAAQQRLDFTCRKVMWVWAHQCAYYFCSLVAVVLHWRHKFFTAGQFGTTERWTTGDIRRWFFDAFMCVIAVTGLVSSLVAPAVCTSLFREAPKQLCVRMCHSGCPVEDTSVVASFLILRCEGFHMFSVPVDAEKVGKFAALVLLVGGVSFVA